MMYNHPFPLRIRSGKAVVVEAIPAPTYEKHQVGPHPVRVKKGFMKKPKMKPASQLTPRALARLNREPNPMPAFVGRMTAHYRKTGRATPNADARRAEKAAN